MTEPRLFNVYCDESCHLEYDGVPVMAWGAVYCPADQTRVKQAANFKDFRTTNLLPGITINTSPIDFAPIKQMQLRRFKGEIWELFGPTLNSEIGG
jgi:hypothetical protein